MRLTMLHFAEDGEGMYQVAIVGTKIPEAMASSSNPWVYLVGLLLIGLAFVARQVWKDMKDGQNRLIILDEKHREESTKREERLNEQLDKSIQATSSIVETQKEMIVAITGVQSNLHELKTETNNRLELLEKTVNKESA